MAAETPTYVAIFEEPIPEDIVKRAEEVVDPGNVYRLSDTVLLLRLGEESTENLGNVLKLSEQATTGVVFRLNGSYTGYHYEALWDWLKVGQ